MENENNQKGIPYGDDDESFKHSYKIANNGPSPNNNELKLSVNLPEADSALVSLDCKSSF